MRSPFLQTVCFEYYVKFRLVDEKLNREIQAHSLSKLCLKSVFPVVVSPHGKYFGLGMKINAGNSIVTEKKKVGMKAQ